MGCYELDTEVVLIDRRHRYLRITIDAAHAGSIIPWCTVLLPQRQSLEITLFSIKETVASCNEIPQRFLTFDWHPKPSDSENR